MYYTSKLCSFHFAYIFIHHYTCYKFFQGIAKIIQRDFFPDLEKLNAQNEFLEATENKDYARLRELTRKYSGQRPPTEPC